jgi:hypothetical protein
VEQIEYEPSVRIEHIAVSDKTIEVIARKALASQDTEFRAHAELLLGRYQVAREHTEREAGASRKVLA